MASSSNKIERGHQMYREGRYGEALGFYTDAIAVAKTNPQRIALHSNRAACYLKLHHFKKAAEECTSVLELDYKHSGALMLRAQTLVTLKEYHSALFDVNRLLELNPTSEVYQNLQARLRTQLSLAPIPESEEEFEEQEEEIEDKTGGLLEGDTKMEERREKYGAPSNWRDQEVELDKGIVSSECTTHEKDSNFSSKQRRDQNYEPEKFTAEAIVPKSPNRESIEQDSKGWQTIPKPKGHSALDYARWDSVEDDSSEDDDDDEDEKSLPQYRFRVRTIGVRPVK